MKPRQPDPLHLDVGKFAVDGGELAGQWPLAELPRLDELNRAPADRGAIEVRWHARGETVAVAGGAPQTWLHLHAAVGVWLTCQRCLQPLAVALDIEPSIRFVAGEAEAERLDADSEHDVLALTRSLDLRELVEDELLLALPLVPRHGRCPEPLAADPAEAAPDQTAPAAPHPFAALAALKRPPKV